MKQAARIIGGSALGLLLWSGLLFNVSSDPIQAQFATNTPNQASVPTQAPNDQATVTLAPLPTVTLEPLATSVPPVVGEGPAAPMQSYGLRLWLEADLIDLLYTQITALKAGDITASRALQLTGYELERRFPGAPTQPNARANLIDVMLQSPRGQVDMRWLVRPYILAEVDGREPHEAFNVGNFSVELTPAHFNADAYEDALLHIRYPSDAEEPSDLRYEEYLFIVGREDGTYTLLPEDFELPAAPLDPVRSLTLERLEDVNKDTLDDLVLSVDDGDVNARWYIIGNRSGRMAELTNPTYEVRVGELLSWPTSADLPEPAVLEVSQLQADSMAPNWDCRSEVIVEWRYSNNYYRPDVPESEDFMAQDTLDCRLLAAEPLFAKPPSEAVNLVQNAVIDYGMEASGSSRALMVLSMLYALNGQLSEARVAAENVQTRAEENDDPWALAQSRALLEALDDTSNTALDICEALVRASEDPACSIDDVLERYLSLVQLTTDSDLLMQLEDQGFTPTDTLTVTEVGKAARIVIHFDYANSGWWAFAAQRDGTYTVERTDPPLGTEDAASEEALLGLPPPALSALLIDDNPRAAVSIIENAMQNVDTADLSGELRFTRALALELIGDRSAALRGYYNLWRDAPTTLWGRMAAAHLEQRG